MTKRFLGLLSCGVICLLTACKNDVFTAGDSVLNDADVIVVKADTFSIRSGIVECPRIISSPDSFLVGEIETDYGVLRADILTQFACPLGYQFPDNAVIDSVCLFMYYRSWLGNGESPLSVNVYEIDRKGLEYAPVKPYMTDLNIDDYCSLTDSTILLYNEKLVVAAKKTDSVYSSVEGAYLPMVRCKLNSSFAQRFAMMRRYEDQEDFNRFFKGIYITSNFGSSTILHMADICLGVYYHFNYKKAESDRDTVIYDMKGFYANSEVRQLNRFCYPDKQELIHSLGKDSNMYNYIIAPAGVYTRMNLPLERMRKVITSQLDTVKRAYVNQAELRVDVLNVYDGSQTGIQPNDWLQPAQYMLLIKENSEERFFCQKELPSDTVALLSSLMSGTDSDGKTNYYYSYDLSTLLTNQLRMVNSLDTLKMLLVPVSVETTSSGSSTGSASIVSVKQSQIISATQIRSANNADNPLTLKVVYSGF